MENQEHLSTSDIESFLTRRLGEKEAGEVMEYIESEVDKRVNERVGAVQEEISLWRNKLSEEFATQADATELRTRLVKRVSAVEGTIILWGFVFWITLILAFYLITRFVS